MDFESFGDVIVTFCNGMKLFGISIMTFCNGMALEPFGVVIVTFSNETGPCDSNTLIQ